VIAFFAPLVFRTVGFGGNGALMGTVILGAVNLVSIIHGGRRPDDRLPGSSETYFNSSRFYYLSMRP
jgi:hypothetical protein